MSFLISTYERHMLEVKFLEGKCKINFCIKVVVWRRKGLNGVAPKIEGGVVPKKECGVAPKTKCDKSLLGRSKEFARALRCH